MVVSPRIRRWVTPIVDQIVYASTAYTDLKSTINQQSTRLIDFSGPPVGEADERLREAVRLLRPMHLPGARLTRVGGGHDGGYVMVDDLEPVTGALSVGVGPDVTWDLGVSRRGIRVVMFDPTVRRLPSKVPGGTFHRIGISGAADAHGPYQPLARLVELAGFTGLDDLLLKVDVEGAEWSAFSGLGEGELAPYRQITTELHDLHRLADPDRSRDVLAALRLISRTHVPVHLHANNYCRLLRFDGDWFPDVVEATFVRRDLAQNAVPAQRVASHLDVPSDRRVVEIDLEGVLALDTGARAQSNEA